MSTKASRRKNNRKNYLINPRFQLGTTGIFFLLGLCNVSALFFGYRFLVNSLFKQFTMLDEKSAQLMTEMLTRQSALIEKSLIFFILFVLTYHIVIGIILFHHVAGPAYAIRKQLRRLNDGETPPPLQLRKHDFMEDVAQELNTLSSKIRSDKESK